MWSLGLIAALVAFAATRAWLLLGFWPLCTDGEVYVRYALAAGDLGLTPYRDIPSPGASLEEALEYPPLGFWLIALPRVTASLHVTMEAITAGGVEPYIDPYLETFSRQMALLDVVSFVLFLSIVRRRRPELLAAAAWGYVAVTTILAHVLYTRLDLGVLVCVLLWASAWLRSGDETRLRGVWQVLSYAALGIGVSFKLIPALIVPLAVVSDLRGSGSRRGAWSLAVGLVLFAVLALGPFAYYYGVAGERVLDLFRYHGTRPCEIESVYATAMLAAAPLGLPIEAQHAFRSWNVVTPESGVSSAMMGLSSVLVFVVWGAAIARACWPGREFGRVEAYRWGCWTIAAAMTLAKVLSIQYLVWGLPVLLLLGTELLPRACYLRLLATLVGVAALSSVVFPYLFNDFLPGFRDGTQNPYPLTPNLHWLPCSLLVLRNAALLGVVAWLTVRLVRECDGGGTPSACGLAG